MPIQRFEIINYLKMPSFCSVVKCSMRGERDNVKFFRIPAAFKGRATMLDALSNERRELWIKSLKRGPLSDTFLKNARICSRHFIKGVPAELEDKDNPDWVPSQNMGYITTKTKTVPEKAIQRHYRSLNRAKRIELGMNKAEDEEQPTTFELFNASCSDHSHGPSCSITPTENQKVQSVLDEITTTKTSETYKSVAVQTEITIDDLCKLFLDLKFCNSQIHELKQRLGSCDLTEDSFKNDDTKCLYFTGLSDNGFFTLYEDVKRFLSVKKALSPFQQLILTLMKLTLNLPFKYMSYRFCICPTTASETFFSTLNILYLRLKHFVLWPSREQLKKNVPACFKEAFNDTVVIIIDCFEVFTETPSNILNASQCWSNYKHHQTIKFLIGITPQGTIAYISKAWGGRTSDKYLTENLDFFNLISPGDIVLADRGFLIEDSLKILGAKLVMPAFTKGKNQLHPKDLESTRNIATVRIHVERIIGLLKKKYKIFQQTIPVSMLSKESAVDEMVVVCSALINLCNSVIPISQ